MAAAAAEAAALRAAAPHDLLLKTQSLCRCISHHELSFGSIQLTWVQSCGIVTLISVHSHTHHGVPSEIVKTAHGCMRGSHLLARCFVERRYNNVHTAAESLRGFNLPEYER